VGWIVRQGLQFINYCNVGSGHRPKSSGFTKDLLRTRGGNSAVTTSCHSSLHTILEQKTIFAPLQSTFTTKVSILLLSNRPQRSSQIPSPPRLNGNPAIVVALMTIALVSTLTKHISRVINTRISHNL
jgi:hypothetical protein